MPAGTFLGAGVKTVVLFFTKGEPTKKIWYFQLRTSRNLGKMDPLNDDDLIEFVSTAKVRLESDKSWFVELSKIDNRSYDLSVKNPNQDDNVIIRDTNEIIQNMLELDKEAEMNLLSLNEI